MLLFNVIDRCLRSTSSSSLLGVIPSVCLFFPFSHQSLLCEYCLSPSGAPSQHLNSPSESKYFCSSGLICACGYRPCGNGTFCNQLWWTLTIVSGDIFLSACCILELVLMKSVMLMSQRASLYDNEMLLYHTALLERPLDFAGQGNSHERFVVPFPELALGLRVALCISPRIYISNDLSSLCRDFLLFDDSSSSLGESYRSLSICSQKYLWTGESLGRYHKLWIICFLPSYLRRVFMRERRV